MKFIFSNWPTILLIMVAIIYIGYLIVNAKWKELGGTAYRLILQAERIIKGSKKGREKFEYVFDKIYSLIPAWFRWLVPKDTLREKLQAWYDNIKDYLDDGKINNSCTSDALPKKP